MMDAVFVENEIKKDIEECLKYFGFKHSSTLVLVLGIM